MTGDPTHAKDHPQTGEVLDSQSLFRHYGPRPLRKVAQFERAFAQAVGARHAVGVTSGTAALMTALAALGVGPGDEVIVPTYTWVATINAVVHLGAVPVFVDIDDSLTMDPTKLEAAVTPCTKAILPVHMRGAGADMGPILDAAAKHHLYIVEDAAQAVGGRYRGRRLGTLGAIGAYSLQYHKTITTGEGGMLLTDSDVLLRRARDLRDYDGRAVHETRFNYKMTDLQAALGISQLRRLPSFLGRRGALAARYAAALRDLPVSLPAVMAGRTHIFYRYVVGVDGAARLAHRLGMRGIQCKPPVFTPLRFARRTPKRRSSSSFSASSARFMP